MYRWLIVAFSLTLFSCASQTPVLESGTTALQAKLGVTQLSDGQKTWKGNDCSHKKLPFIFIEKSEILPDSTARGKELRHHFVYVACTSSDYGVIVGKLTRKISYKGTVTFLDTTEKFEIAPGTWEVNAIIVIPRAAELGDYNLELTLSGPKIQEVQRTTFTVQK